MPVTLNNTKVKYKDNNNQFVGITCAIDPSTIIDDTAGDGDTGKVWSADKTIEAIGEMAPVQDVQIDGTSILSNGVANVPIATDNVLGLIKSSGSVNGLIMSGQYLFLVGVTEIDCKSGTNIRRPVVASMQHASVFYGLAKAAGANMNSLSSVTVGQYPEAQKSAISTMLNAPVSISGTTPTITALPGIQYICGEVDTLNIILPESGCIDVIFQSGATATTLTITPPTGQTVKWMNGFDPTSLDADTTYEINICNGLGVVGSWT